MRKTAQYTFPTFLLSGWAFLQLTRPVFLLGGILLFALGTAIAFYSGYTIRWDLYFLGQILVTSTQLVAQYANEYYDIEVDRIGTETRTWFSGGSGVLSSGKVSPRIAINAARFFTVIGCIAAVRMFFFSPPAGLIGLISLLGAWFYSAPPFSLMGSGWGEVAATVIVAFLVPFTAVFTQTRNVVLPELIITAPLALVHLAMLIVFEIPDLKADTTVGKRTLTVRYGIRKMLLLHASLLIVAFIFYAYLDFTVGIPIDFVWLALPLAFIHAVSLFLLKQRQAARFNWGTFTAIALFAILVLFQTIDILRYSQ